MSLLQNKGEPSLLHLADGSEPLQCRSFGATPSDPVLGEVVFNTGMVGYPEALSDPSYRGQILVLTYPLVGNYGVPDDTIMDEHGLPVYFESKTIQIAALVVSSYSWYHSHWTAKQSLGQWLEKAGVPGVYGIDTRALTKKLRTMGAVPGAITVHKNSFPQSVPSIEFQDPNERNLVSEVSTKQVVTYGEGNSPTVIAYDFGMKFNIIRYFVNEHKVKLVVVPFNYDLEKNPSQIEWDGLFLSNGPGDPSMMSEPIRSVQYALSLEPPKPIFGICLGNQILSLAAGAKTYKMKYGNRGMNQPCIDLRTGRCYITPQNHGYAVDSKTLPYEWLPLFVNANDETNEGIVSRTKPFFSVQFHPEASGGPTDTAFLFEKFVGHVRNIPQPLNLQSTKRYQLKTYKKVLLVGSGGLSIGQAGEFDYSGSQCIKALKEEGIEVILINPNIATVQTSQEKEKKNPGPSADTVYFLPIRPEVVMEIIHKEKPDGIIVSMGGQTALNVGVQLWKSGELQKAGVEVLGTQIPVIEATEDREIFSDKLKEIDETIALSYSATNIEEALAAANKIGYPVLVRAAYALGGLGSGFAANDSEMKELAQKAFCSSDQILIDQDLRGWKELEYEVVRDNEDNCITVCNMENFDPLGIHTGDSIVVAPSQTLSNDEYFMLRKTALKVVRHLGIVGECNIQYALHPKSLRYCIIEVNARLSRSSALASKATGYPLAYVATKLSLGKDLVSIKNSVTKNTTACFEPSLDYCVLKMPRWDLKKFSRVSKNLGSSMLSVGEVMAIGRTFEEVMQKACRMVNPALDGLEGHDSNLVPDHSPLDEQLKKPTDTRLFAVQTAFENGYSIDQVHELTKIDPWFLRKLENIAKMRNECKTGGSTMFDGPDAADKMRALKMSGFSDLQIGRHTMPSIGARIAESKIRAIRKSLNVVPCVKQIDTLAAEFPAMTNYLYMTYSGYEDDVDTVRPNGSSNKSLQHQSSSTQFLQERARSYSVVKETLADKKQKGVMVLGCGAYCIGSSVEFDWAAVSCVRQLRRDGFKAIVVNYNPETVSTDYDESDRLYFEELSLERVLDIYEREGAHGVVVSVGGQIPNNLAGPLADNEVNILGTSARDIERAEDRRQFSDMLDNMEISQPAWSVLKSKEDAVSFANRVGFPVLVRPSFVLSGAAMRVASDEKQLKDFLDLAADVAADKPVVVTKFILNAKEIEFDAVAHNGKILNYAIGEHLENAGVHSGDATVILPAQKLYVHTIRQVKKYSSAIAKALNITGPFNIQYMAKGNDVTVIECNLRASRTVPFVSKTLNHNFISLATKAMCGMEVKPYRISLLDIEYVCVKAPMFSFTRLRGADPTLGVEMSSTGEVACFGNDEHEAFIQSLMATGFKLPPKDGVILLSIASDEFRKEFTHAAHVLNKMGYKLMGTPGTSKYYADVEGLSLVSMQKPVSEDDEINNDGSSTILKEIRDGKVNMIINISEGTTRKDEISSGYIMRRAAVDYGVSLITDVKCAIRMAECLGRGLDKYNAKHIGEFYDLPTVGWSK